MPRHHKHLLKVPLVIVVISRYSLTLSTTVPEVHDFHRERLVTRRPIKTGLGHNTIRNFLLLKREILRLHHC